MPEKTTDYRIFTGNEHLDGENFALAYELYQAAEGRESHGSFKSERRGEVLVITRDANPYELHLVHQKAVDGFLSFLRYAFMDRDEDSERWYSLKIATKRAD